MPDTTNQQSSSQQAADQQSGQILQQPYSVNLNNIIDAITKLANSLNCHNWLSE